MAGGGRRLIGVDALRAFAADLLMAGGFSAEHASATAAVLVWANLRGADSHGVLRIPRYVEMVEQGLIDPDAIPTETMHKGALSLIDARRAPGAVAMNAAADRAAHLAGIHGIGWCAVRAISHAGAIGAYAELVTKAGYVGLAVTASKPLMVYHGSRKESVSTNPIAIGAPTDDPARPILLDMSTASVAMGKVTAAKDAGRPIPSGWGVDENGENTTDPARVKAVLPMAGAKGSGLSLMIEILASVLVGNPLVSIALRDGGDPGANGLVLALDPTVFGDRFASDIASLATQIRQLPPAADTEAVLLPGERGYAEMMRRTDSGIPVAGGTWARLVELAAQKNVTVPEDM